MQPTNNLSDIAERLRAAEGAEITCADCPLWKPEPTWKQILFLWRGGLWLGRCDCYLGGPIWHAMPCGRAAPMEKTDADH